MQKFQAISAAYTKLVSVEDEDDDIPTVSYMYIHVLTASYPLVLHSVDESRQMSVFCAFAVFKSTNLIVLLFPLLSHVYRSLAVASVSAICMHGSVCMAWASNHSQSIRDTHTPQAWAASTQHLPYVIF